MNTPQELRDISWTEMNIRKREYDDETIIVVDFGDDFGELSMDVVDDMAIVVVDGQQLEFEVPAEASEITVNNGILTIEG